MVRTPADFQSIIANNPFLKQDADPKSLHATFLDKPADADGLKKLSAISAGADKFAADGSVIYLCCPNGYGKTKLSNNAIERVLSRTATTRNWNTVTTLLAMAEAE